MVTVFGNLFIEDEYNDLEICYKLEIDKHLLDRIKYMSDKLSEMKMESDISGLFEITAFDYAVSDYVSGNLTEVTEEGVTKEYEELRAEDDSPNLDCVLLQVQDGVFRFTGYVKHTQIAFSTGTISVAQVDSDVAEKDTLIVLEN